MPQSSLWWRWLAELDILLSPDPIVVRASRFRVELLTANRQRDPWGPPKRPGKHGENTPGLFLLFPGPGIDL